jgi:hypothetical protein
MGRSARTLSACRGRQHAFPVGTRTRTGPGRAQEQGSAALASVINASVVVDAFYVRSRASAAPYAKATLIYLLSLAQQEVEDA